MGESWQITQHSSEKICSKAS